MLNNCTCLNGSCMIVVTTIYFSCLPRVTNLTKRLFNVTSLKHAKLILSYSRQL